MGKGLLGPKGGICGGKGRREGSMAGRGGGLLAKRSIKSNDGLGGGGLVVHEGKSSRESKNREDYLYGCDGGEEIKGGGVDFEVLKSLSGEVPDETIDMARWMGCDIREFSFTYLGLTIRENMRRVNAWTPVIGRRRLVCWIEWDGSMVDGCGNGIGDRWRWSLVEDRVFTVKELSRLIEEKILLSDNGGQEILWNKLVPKKINIFVWRALRGRLLVRVKLDKRAMSVWDKIFNWWKVGSVNAFTIDEFLSSNALGRHLEEIHVTWAQFWKKPDKMAIWHEDGLKNQDQSVETVSRLLVTPFGFESDDVRIFVTASGHNWLATIKKP
ncbi:RNA-directed DNA polymerase, eukaryota, reverse transcriptase zinc-binding domain protein [Tanacetum coccineum]